MTVDEALVLLASAAALSAVAVFGAGLQAGALAGSRHAYCMKLAEVINATALSLREGEEAVIILPRPAGVLDGKACGIYPTLARGSASGRGCLIVYRHGGVVGVRGC